MRPRQQRVGLNTKFRAGYRREALLSPPATLVPLIAVKPCYRHRQP